MTPDLNYEMERAGGVGQRMLDEMEGRKNKAEACRAIPYH